MIRKLLKENGFSKNPIDKFENKTVNVKEEVIRLSNLGFDYKPIENNEWLMQKKILG